MAKVVIYTKDPCPFCVRAINFMKDKGIEFKDVEILNDESGKPYVVLYGRAQEVFKEMGGRSISLSIS
ncbi:MAG: hypothetical protein N2578_07475, partial [Bdellovibrionaceae bacterium]|nr:hypothetical protein [Pseudobdellovibrionaceae bacterium]